jgi:hypothetical protein
VGYATTKRVCQKGEIVPISHKQACRDLGLKPVQLRDRKKNVDKILSTTKGSTRGTLTHTVHFPVLEDRLHSIILDKRRLGRSVGEKWIRRHARLEYESLFPERVTIVEKKVFSGMAFSNGWFRAFLKRKHLSLRASTKTAQVVPADYKDKITSWLQFNRHAQDRFNFELLEIANMDQTPIAFEFLDGRTYDTTGVRTVFVDKT